MAHTHRTQSAQKNTGLLAPSIPSPDWQRTAVEAEQKRQDAERRIQELEARCAEINDARALLEARCHALEVARAQWASLATSDGMTGLANHRAFQEELARQRARAERANAPLSLLLLDVDHFKAYNDNFGHPAGDEVLQSVGALLTAAVREGDFAARYGGEEFAIILPETDLETAMQVGERVRAAVEAQTFVHRAVTVSIGVTRYLSPESTDALIQRADVALYEAKSAGRNRLALLAPEPNGEEENVDQTDAPRIDACLELSKSAGSRAPFAYMHSDTPEAHHPDQLDVFDLESESTSLSAWMHWKGMDGGIEGLLQEPTAPILSELLALLDARDDAPAGHSERVARSAMHRGRELAAYYDAQRDKRPLLPRLTGADLLNIAFGALLHDIGKMGISEGILRKTGKLTDEEWRQMRRHPLSGSAMLLQSPLLARALPIVRYHHERWDGAGYPQGLAGEDIPISARVFAVCDTLDVLTNAKPYRPALSYVEARDEIVRMSGTQFDPDVVAAFLRVPESVWHLPPPLTPSASAVSRAA